MKIFICIILVFVYVISFATIIYNLINIRRSSKQLAKCRELKEQEIDDILTEFLEEHKEDIKKALCITKEDDK